ncbi:hypothetical protein D3C78_1744170 [compost metagenome]
MDKGLENGKEYRYEVVAVNAIGKSEPGKVTAKPDRNGFDFRDEPLPFTVESMIKSAVGFLSIYGAWILVALAVVFSPVIYQIVLKLIANMEKRNNVRYRKDKG